MRFQIHDLFLHSSNKARFGLKTVGEIIAASGKEQLWSERRNPLVDVVVIHYISAIERFPENPYRIDNIIPIFAEYGVSSHYLITRRGKIYHLVPLAEKAWHCGGSVMPPPDDRQNVNEFSIGIELMATASSGFTELQYESLGKLCYSIEKYSRTTISYVGHDQIAGLRAIEMGLRDDCKADPGPLFDWERFFSEIDRCRSFQEAFDLPK